MIPVPLLPSPHAAPGADPRATAGPTAGNEGTELSPDETDRLWPQRSGSNNVVGDDGPLGTWQVRPAPGADPRAAIIAVVEQLCVYRRMSSPRELLEALVVPLAALHADIARLEAEKTAWADDTLRADAEVARLTQELTEKDAMNRGAPR